MEKSDLELIDELTPKDDELKALVEEHHALEVELERYQSRAYLTPAEELEKKRIQKVKLAGKDRIEEILMNYRKQNES